MEVTTVIVIKGGMVCDVYSTLPSVNHDIQVLDLDNAEQESPEENERMEALLEEVTSSPDFHVVH